MDSHGDSVGSPRRKRVENPGHVEKDMTSASLIANGGDLSAQQQLKYLFRCAAPAVDLSTTYRNLDEPNHTRVQARTRLNFGVKDSVSCVFLPRSLGMGATGRPELPHR